MIFCTNCGARNDSGTRFCTNCGVEFPVQNVTNPASSDPMPAEEAYPSNDMPESQGIVSNAQMVAPAKKMDRRTKILICAIGVLFIVLIAVFMTLKNTVFSPQGPLNSYISAIAEGKYRQASKMVDPDVKNDARALLVDKVGSDAGHRIQDVKASPVRQDRTTGQWVSTVTYSVDGVQHSADVTMQPDGKKFLIFNSWKIVTPLVKTLKIAVPKTMTNVTVNGVDVDLSHASTAKDDAPDSEDDDMDVDTDDMVRYSVPVYPGVYQVGVADSKYVTAKKVKISDTEENTAYVVPQATSALKDAVLAEVQNHVNDCIASSELNEKNCGFLNGDFRSDSSIAYSNVKRKVSNRPKLKELDVVSGTFSTDTIDAVITYQERYHSDDPWENETSDRSGSLEGTFTLKNEHVSVTINNDDDTDYDFGW